MQNQSIAIRSGLLRHRVVIEQKTHERDSKGGMIERWDEADPFARVWANVEVVGGTEQHRANQVQTTDTHRVTLRYLPGLTTRMRLKHNGRVLNIQSIKNIGERNRVLELMCIEG